MTLPSRAETSGIVVVEEEAPVRDGFLHCAGASHPGLMRQRNEDRLHVDAARGILAVVDGMGGEAAGEIAADTAIQALLGRLERSTGPAERRVREAITFANNEIFRLARENPEWAGMGCVLTLALVENGMVTVGHVGDSRLYRLRAGTIDKVTHDHSPIGMREDAGELGELEAMRHPRRNEVYRSVGTQPHGPEDQSFIELIRFKLEPEDAILICSDGLTDVLPAGDIVRVVREHADDPRSVVQGLIDKANAAGGKDNVTVAYAAGDRFPRAFLEAPVPRPGKGNAPGLGMRLRSVLNRRSTFFVLGAVSGILAYAGFSLLDRTTSPAGRLLPFAGVGDTRHQVGPGLEFRTIGEALDQARPGDTITVAPGRYPERVRLRDGVTLIGAGPGRAVLAPAGDGSGQAAALVLEGLGSGRAAGFTIASAAAAPLDYGIVIRSAGVSVENIEVHGARVAGVSIEGAGTASLTASHIHDNAGAGILVRGHASPRILSNRIVDNGGALAKPGIDLEPGARAELAGNVIVGNGAEGVRGVAPEMRAEVLGGNVFEALGKNNRRGAIRLATRGAVP